MTLRLNTLSIRLIFVLNDVTDIYDLYTALNLYANENCTKFIRWNSQTTIISYYQMLRKSMAIDATKLCDDMNNTLH